MINDPGQREVLAATANLATSTTTPSTQQIADWVAGRFASQGAGTPFAGPPPWYGLEGVIRKLETAGLVETGGEDSPAPPAENNDAARDDVGRWVAVTPAGLAELGR